MRSTFFSLTRNIARVSLATSSLIEPRAASRGIPTACFRFFCTTSSAEDVSENVASLNALPAIIQERLAARGIKALYPVQAKTLGPLRNGEDVLAQSETGSGKTLAFGLPIVERLLEEQPNKQRGRDPSAVILAPTRELAKQVAEEMTTLAQGRTGPSLSVAAIYGGASYTEQFQSLERGIDILVATPGRLVDHITRGSVRLSQAKVFVIDECDEMLRIGFRKELDSIIGELPKGRQNVMFSATVPHEVKNIVRRLMGRTFTHIDLVQGRALKAADSISQLAVPCHYSRRLETLQALLLTFGADKKALIFCERKTQADSLAMDKALNLRCRVIHGDIAQKSREEALQRFRKGDINVLIATDVAARGIDIPDVDLVIQYTVPQGADTFVHRTGRTGRAGKSGQAIVIYDDREAGLLKSHRRELLLDLTYTAPPIPSSDGLLNVLSGKDAISNEHISRSDFVRILPLARDAFKAWSHEENLLEDWIDIKGKLEGMLGRLILNSPSVVALARGLQAFSVLSGRPDFVCFEYIQFEAKQGRRVFARDIQSFLQDAGLTAPSSIREGARFGTFYSDVHISEATKLEQLSDANASIVARPSTTVPQFRKEERGRSFTKRRFQDELPRRRRPRDSRERY